MAPRSYPKAAESDLPSTDSEGMSDNNSGDSKGRSSRRISLDKGSEEYKKRRERNNLAVKKSRCKSKQKTQETLERVNLLREENALLESKIQLLSKELSFLKDLFLAHAGNAHGNQLKDLDLNALLSSDGPSSVDLTHNNKDKAAGRDHQYSVGDCVKMEV